MADSVEQRMLEGLRRALAAPDGLPLFAARAREGLFANAAIDKKAAHRCQELGYLQLLSGAEGRWALTDEGLAFVLSQTNPQAALEKFGEALEARRRQLDEILTGVRQCQASFDYLYRQARALRDAANGRGGCKTSAGDLPAGNGGEEAWLEFLSQWERTEKQPDCELPVWFGHARRRQPDLTLGQFHDALRRWYAEGRIYLHPWTGPLHEIPEPAAALLIGHAVAYYASPRRDGGAPAANHRIEVES